MNTVQAKRNKRISRSAAARRNESMQRQSLKPRQYAAASRISPRNFASVRRGMPRVAQRHAAFLKRLAAPFKANQRHAALFKSRRPVFR
ncbi:hypothetical protein DPMN_019468, partial [Dreissena polymorpha]